MGSGLGRAGLAYAPAAILSLSNTPYYPLPFYLWRAACGTPDFAAGMPLPTKTAFLAAIAASLSRVSLDRPTCGKKGREE